MKVKKRKKKGWIGYMYDVHSLYVFMGIILWSGDVLEQSSTTGNFVWDPVTPAKI